MLINQKHAFWEALVIAVFIFGLGVLLGVFVEHSRQETISEAYLNSEIDMLDIRIQTEALNLETLSCTEAVQKNIEFADKVFEDAKLLKKYEDASRITNSLVQQHKRYDLLRTLLWINSIKIKQRCGNNSFHTVVYLYDYEPENLELTSKQTVFSRFLQELKNQKGNQIVLIPIAKNLDISSLDLLTNNLNIQSTSVVVDEGTLIISEPEDFYKITQYLS